MVVQLNIRCIYTIRHLPQPLTLSVQAQPADEVHLRRDFVACCTGTRRQRQLGSVECRHSGWSIPSRLRSIEAFKSISRSLHDLGPGAFCLLGPDMCWLEEPKHAISMRHFGWRTSVLIATYHNYWVPLCHVIHKGLRLSATELVILLLKHHTSLLVFAHATANASDDDILVHILALRAPPVKQESVNSATICVTSTLGTLEVREGLAQLLPIGRPYFWLALWRRF